MQDMKKARFASVLIMLPAVMLGIAAMEAANVSPLIWGQHAAAYFVFAMIGTLCCSPRRIRDGVWVGLLMAVLASTLLFPEVGGAKRWLDLGIFNINAAQLVLPALLVLSAKHKNHCAIFLSTAAVLFLQPDSSQGTALLAGALPILWNRRQKTSLSMIAFGALVTFALVSFAIPTTLHPVEYCEGILSMLNNLSPVLKVIGWITLAIIPCFWAYCFYQSRSAALLSLALYYAVSLSFGLTGEYPVPFMGFGISSIAGYCLALVFFQSSVE